MTRYRLAIVAAACTGVFGCAAEGLGVTGNSEALTTTPGCEVAQIGSLVVPSRDGHQIAIRPSELHLVLADGVQMWPAARVVTNALADEAMMRTAADIMAWPPLLFAEAVANTAGDPSFTICGWAWETVTDFDTNEVVESRDFISPD